MSDTWKPTVTVAAIIEKDNHFLMIEEYTSEGIRFNQPAGHLEPNESLIEAVIRETDEETAYEFMPKYLVGIYSLRYASKNQGTPVSFLRFAFSGEIGQIYSHPLDKEIIRTLWMSHQDLVATQHQHRSHLVLQCVEDYLAGIQFPLSVIH